MRPSSWPSQAVKVAIENAIEKVHQVRFLNIYILLHITYYIPPLTVIIALAIKAIGFSKVRQAFSNVFPIHFLFRFFIISD